MTLRIPLLIIQLFFLIATTCAQGTISGRVVDQKGGPLFAVNVYLASNINTGVASGIDGRFEITYHRKEDTLIISYLGFETQNYPLTDIENNFIKVTLATADLSFDQITILAKEPISEDFAVSKLEKLDIYIDPFAQGDALRSVSTSPSASTSDESANPSLRGSSASRSIVYFNNVPIYNPVRNSQINGIGNFSIFNTAIIDNQYIYPSNPPLSYGNTSAGVIAIESNSKLEFDELQVSSTLASLGFLASRRLGDESFVQAFSNVQFSAAFIGLNQTSTELLNSFSSNDVGLNFHTKWKGWEYNSLAYFVNESYNVNLNQFTHEAEAAAENLRFYTVQNLSKLLSKGKISFDFGFNRSNSGFNFGNLYTERKNRELYLSARYKHFFSDDFSVEGGLVYDHQNINFRDSVPTFYYAMSKASPNFFRSIDAILELPETFLYASKKLSRDLRMQIGLRSNFQISAQQIGLSYQPKSTHRAILSLGNYYSFTRPNYNATDFEILKSRQAALDYLFDRGDIKLQGAIYYKKEVGERSFDFFSPIQEVETFGLEFFIDYQVHPFWRLTFSNNYIDQKQVIFGEDYRGRFDFNYFIKSSLTFTHPKFPILSLSYIGRPGLSYNEIVGSNFDRNTNFHVPIFADSFYTGNFNAYNRLDLAISKYVTFGNNAITYFINIANLLDIENQQSVTFDADYSNFSYVNFQERSLFFGLVWSRRKY